MTLGWVRNNISFVAHYRIFFLQQPYFWLLAKKVAKTVEKKVAKTCSSLETLPASFRGSKSGGTGWQIRGSAPTEDGCVIRMMSKASSAKKKKHFWKAKHRRRYYMNGRSQMQGGKNWIWEINANRFFWDSHWAGNLDKPILSLYGTELRERGYGLWENKALNNSGSKFLVCRQKNDLIFIA